MIDNEDLAQKALSGDEIAAKMYCGSYTLVQRISDGKWFRCKGDIPKDFTRIDTVLMKSVYDKDGFLKPKYWSLPRTYDK